MSILSIIIFAGAIHGLFLSFTLWIHNRGNRLANKLLALLIFLFCLYLIIPELIRTYPEQLPHLIASTFPILYTIGPLTLFYVTAIRFKNISDQKLYLHFLPAVLCLLVLLPFFIKSGESKLDFYYAIRSHGMSYLWSLLWGASCLHIAIYSYFSGRQIQFFKENLKDRYSNIDELNLSWLKTFILVISGLWGLYLLLFLISLTGITIDPYGIVDYIFSISIAVVIFIIGFMAFRKPEVFSELTESRKKNADSYSKSGLNEEKAKKYADKLKILLEEGKPYLNADLTLEELAEKMELPPKYLSEVLNKEIGVNFYELINIYRAREAKRLLERQPDGDITILEVMYDSGFNSKSTFNKYFKKTFRETPSQFRNKMT